MLKIDQLRIFFDCSPNGSVLPLQYLQNLKVQLHKGFSLFSLCCVNQQLHYWILYATAWDPLVYHAEWNHRHVEQLLLRDMSLYDLEYTIFLFRWGVLVVLLPDSLSCLKHSTHQIPTPRNLLLGLHQADQESLHVGLLSHAFLYNFAFFHLQLSYDTF